MFEVAGRKTKEWIYLKLRQKETKKNMPLDREAA